jgi:hypothetical protein
MLAIMSVVTLRPVGCTTAELTAVTTSPIAVPNVTRVREPNRM